MSHCSPICKTGQAFGVHASVGWGEKNELMYGHYPVEPWPRVWTQ